MASSHLMGWTVMQAKLDATSGASGEASEEEPAAELESLRKANQDLTAKLEEAQQAASRHIEARNKLQVNTITRPSSLRVWLHPCPSIAAKGRAQMGRQGMSCETGLTLPVPLLRQLHVAVQSTSPKTCSIPGHNMANHSLLRR